VTSGKMTPSRQGLTSDQEISYTMTISQDILKDPVKVLYLFQCFQEAQDDKLCDILSKSFESGEIIISNKWLLPYQVVSLGFFLSRSHREWKELRLWNCHIGDHGINLLHHYLCGDETNKQKITIIDFGANNLTVASSPLIGDIITHLQPHTLKLEKNSVTDISTAVINTDIVKVLHMEVNGLTAQEASAISDMMTGLEKLNINGNKLDNDGVKIISEGITKTNTLRELDISDNNITSTGATAIAKSLLHNTSLEVLDMSNNAIGQDGAIGITQIITNSKTLKKLYIRGCEISTGATAIANSLLCNTSLEVLDMKYNAIGQDGAIASAQAIAQAIANNKTLKILLLYNNDRIDEESAMIMMRSLHHNNYITKLELPLMLRFNDNVKREVENINNTRRKCNIQKLTIDSY